MMHSIEFCTRSLDRRSFMPLAQHAASKSCDQEVAEVRNLQSWRIKDDLRQDSGTFDSTELLLCYQLASEGSFVYSSVKIAASEQ